MKRIIILFIINLVYISAAPQEKKDNTDLTGRMKLTDGTFIDMYGSLTTYDENMLMYHDKEGKARNINRKRTEWIYWGGHVWFYRTADKGSKWFLELMSMNEKYKLFYLENGLYKYFYIFDHNNELVEKEIEIKPIKSMRGPKFNPEPNQAAYTTIKKYFSDCPDLMTEMDRQIKNEENLNCKGYIACPGAKDLKEILK
jgi:hypothetical protein